jgi:hypothetical protein
MAAAPLAKLAVAQICLLELAEIFGAFGDFHPARLPQRESVDRARRPGSA